MYNCGKIYCKIFEYLIELVKEQRKLIVDELKMKLLRLRINKKGNRGN